MNNENINLSAELYGLIDRMQAATAIKYPNRPWSTEFYYNVAWEWRDKIEELKKRVDTLERETGLK